MPDPLAEPVADLAPPSIATPPLPTPPVPQPDWKDGRIRELAAKNGDAQRRIEQLTAEIEANKAKPAVQQTPPVAAGFDEAEVDRRASAKATAMAATALFNQRCNDAVSEGQKVYGASEFDSRVREVRALESLNPEGYANFLAAALETGEASKLLYALGGDKDAAARLMALPPIKMALELGRLSLSDEAPKQRGEADPSETPKPIRALGGGRGTHQEAIDPRDTERSDKLSDDEWFARRNAQVEKQRAGGRG